MVSPALDHSVVLHQLAVRGCDPEHRSAERPGGGQTARGQTRWLDGRIGAEPQEAAALTDRMRPVIGRACLSVASATGGKWYAGTAIRLRERIKEGGKS